MAKNMTMAAKHAKAKSEGMKEVKLNTYADMARGVNTKQTWSMTHKPCYK